VERCKEKGCKKPAELKGYCAGHYRQFLRAKGDPSQLRPLRGAHGKIGAARMGKLTLRVSVRVIAELDRTGDRSAAGRRALESFALSQIREREGDEAARQAADEIGTT
jgi:hypothetical protein